MSAEAAARALAEGAIKESAIIGGDVTLEVSLVGLLVSLQTSVAAGFAEMREAMAGKTDKVDFERLQERLVGFGDRLTEIESWKTENEHAAASNARRDERDNRRIAVALRTVGAMWGMATTMALILATAGVWHP